MNKYYNITIENIDSERFCCFNQGDTYKRKWLKEQLKQGHIFRKLNIDGKVFIEYAPLELSYVPILGENYLYIYCLKVETKYKGNGYGKELLNYVINEAKRLNKSGVCVLATTKKQLFMQEDSFFLHHQFKVVDKIGHYELLALSFNSTYPYFSPTINNHIDDKQTTIYYTYQCPYVQSRIEELTKSYNIKLIEVNSLNQAKNLPCLFNNYALFINKKFITCSILNLKEYIEYDYKEIK